MNTLLMHLQMASIDSDWIGYILDNYKNLDSFTLETCLEFIKENRLNDVKRILKMILKE